MLRGLRKCRTSRLPSSEFFFISAQHPLSREKLRRNVSFDANFRAAKKNHEVKPAGAGRNAE